MDTKVWVKQLIDTYNKAETQESYDKRSKNEFKNIKTVLTAIQNQSFSLTDQQKAIDFVHMLKAAETISLSVGPNYLEQFLKIPDVQSILAGRASPQNARRLTERAVENIKNGKLPDFPKTVAEIDKSGAEMYLTNPNLERTPIEEYKRFYARIFEVRDSNKFTVKTDAKTLNEITGRQNMMIRLARVILRQQGNNPGQMKIENGRLEIDMDVPESPPIYHGMRQTRGMSVAQQEEEENKQEAEKRHQEESKKLQEKRDKQTRDNNKKTTFATQGQEKRSANIAEKQAMFAKSAFYSEKSASFKQSLRVAIDHSEQHTRNVVLQNNNKNNDKRKSHGMSR